MRVIVPIVVGFAIAGCIAARMAAEFVVPRRPEWRDVLGGEAA